MGAEYVLIFIQLRKLCSAKTLRKESDPFQKDTFKTPLVIAIVPKKTNVNT